MDRPDPRLFGRHDLLADRYARFRTRGAGTRAYRGEGRDIAAFGLDTPSIDYGQSTDFRSHVILYRENIPGFENIANLSALPPSGTFVVALPTKIDGGSGGPLRIVAYKP